MVGGARTRPVGARSAVFLALRHGAVVEEALDAAQTRRVVDAGLCRTEKLVLTQPLGRQRTGRATRLAPAPVALRADDGIAAGRGAGSGHRGTGSAGRCHQGHVVVGLPLGLFGERRRLFGDGQRPPRRMRPLQRRRRGRRRQRLGRRRLVRHLVAAQGTDQGQMVVRRAADVDVRMRLRVQRSGTAQQRSGRAVALISRASGRVDSALERSVDVLVARSLAVRSRLGQRDHLQVASGRMGR